MYRIILGLLVSLVLQLPTVFIKTDVAIPNYPVKAIAVSGDGKKLGVIGETAQKSAKQTTYFFDILDVATLEILRHVEIGIYLPDLFDISSDGRWIVYNIPSTELHAIDTISGESLLLSSNGMAEVGSVSWNPHDSRLAFSTGRGLNIISLDPDQPTAYLNDENNRGFISSVDWNPIGDSLVTAMYYASNNDVENGSGNLQLWDETQITSSGIVTTPIKRFEGGGSFLAWSPTGERIASSEVGQIILFNTISDEQTILLTPTGDSITSLTWSPDGSQVAGGNVDRIWVWDAKTGQLVHTISTNGVVNALVWLEGIGLIHNGDDDGIYIDGKLVTSPLVLPTTPLS
jgi:Tol biopolymer transport system component